MSRANYVSNKNISGLLGIENKIIGLTPWLQNNNASLWEKTALKLTALMEEELQSARQQMAGQPWYGSANVNVEVTSPWLNQYGFGASLVGEQAEFVEYGTGTRAIGTYEGTVMAGYEYNAGEHHTAFDPDLWIFNLNGEKIFSRGWKAYQPAYNALTRMAGQLPVQAETVLPPKIRAYFKE